MEKDREDTEEKQLSKNAQKKLKKQQMLEQRKAEKRQDQPRDQNQKVEDPKEYFENRSAQVLQMKDTGAVNPFPHKFESTHSIQEVIREFKS